MPNTLKTILNLLLEVNKHQRVPIFPGHYEDSVELGKYFRCMMWLAKSPWILAGNGASTRSLASSLFMLDILKQSKALETMETFDRIIRYLIGDTDSMSFTQLNALVRGGKRRNTLFTFFEFDDDVIKLKKCKEDKYCV